MKDLNIKARLFASAAVAKATHDIRYYLNGIYVDPDTKNGGAFIVATNGHMMVVWRDETATGVERPIILKADCKLISACAGSDLKRLVVRDSRLAVVLEADDKEIYIQPIEAKKIGVPSFEIEANYPDWRRVMPDDAEIGLKGFVSAKYIAAVDRALSVGCTGYSKYGSLQFMQADENSGVLVTSSMSSNFAAVIMPMRGEATPYPDWVAAKKTEYAAEVEAKNAKEAALVAATDQQQEGGAV